MRIHRIHLQHVAGVDDRVLEFDDGVTVVVGPNEAGKSTIATALQLLLDEKDRADKASVRAVRPVHADLDPTIELECTTGPYRVTYRKVFGRTAGRRETSLTIHTPTRASLTGDAAHDRMCAILDETVDEQLWAALRVQQRHDVGQADLTASGALAAALDAAGTGASTLTDDGSLLARVDEAAAEFWTDTGRPRRTLTDAEAAVEQAGAALAAARAELEATREATERHDRLVVRLADWRRALPDLQRRAKETAEALTQVTDLRSTLAAADARVEAAERDAVRARDAQADRAMLVDRCARLATVVDDRARDLQAATEAAERADRSVTEARTARDAARDEVDTVRRAVRAAEDDVLLLRRTAEVVQLTARITEAEQLHAAREAARGRLDDRAPTTADIRRLETLHERVRTTRAVLDADLPRLRVTGPVGAAVAVDDQPLTLDGAPLERTLDAGVVLRVGEVTVELTPGASATELADAHADATHALRVALEEAGVPDVAAARARRDAAQDAQRELQATEAEWARLTAVDGLDGLRAALDRTQRTIAQVQDRRETTRALPDDVHDAEVLVAAHEAELEQALGLLATAEAGLEAATEAAVGARTALATASARLEGAREQSTEAATALATARATTSDDALAAATADAATAVTTAVASRSEAADALTALDVASIEADADAAATRLAATRDQVTQADLERATLWGAIEASAASGLGEREPELAAALADAEARHDALRRTADALLLLRETLHRHRDAARARYRTPLREAVERLGRVVFGESFEVELDDELRVVARTLHGRTLDVEQLSGGAQEQLAIITRLAAASLVAPEDGVPVILDDALGYADPTRADRVNALLAAVGERVQVIVLTCDPDRFAAVRGARTVQVA